MKGHSLCCLVCHQNRVHSLLLRKCGRCSCDGSALHILKDLDQVIHCYECDLILHAFFFDGCCYAGAAGVTVQISGQVRVRCQNGCCLRLCGLNVIIVDTTITLSTLVLGKGFRLPIYSILLIVIEGKVIDIVVDGLKSYKTVFIVTNKYDAVREVIISKMKRGGTHIHAKGLYQGLERDLVYVSLTRRELVTLRNLLSDADPEAFVSVSDSSEVMGRGFKALRSNA